MGFLLPQQLIAIALKRGRTSILADQTSRRRSGVAFDLDVKHRFGESWRLSLRPSRIFIHGEVSATSVRAVLARYRPSHGRGI